MQKNDFKIVPKKEKKGFSRNLIILFLVCLLLLLPFAIRSFVFLIAESSYMTWKYSVFLFLKDVVLELTFVILFLVVLVILCTQKPFSKILLRCSTGLGILYIVTAIIVPRLPDFELQTFILVGINDVIIFEGFYFIIGLVLIIFSVLMKADLIIKLNWKMKCCR